METVQPIRVIWKSRSDRNIGRLTGCFLKGPNTRKNTGEVSPDENIATVS